MTPPKPPESSPSAPQRLRFKLMLERRAKPSGKAWDYFDALREQPVGNFQKFADLLPDDYQWQEDTLAMTRQVHPNDLLVKAEHPFFDFFVREYTPSLTCRVSRWYRTYLDLSGKPVPSLFRSIEPFPVRDLEFMRGLGLHVQDCAVATTAPSYSDRVIVRFLIQEDLLVDQGLMDFPEYEE